MPRPNTVYPFRPTPEIDGERRHCPVVIVGAGPVGMAAARDLALRGIRSVVLDDDDRVSVGSRAICWAQRTLQVFQRLGCAAPMLEKGVTWNTGKVFYGDDRDAVYQFDLLPDRRARFPAFVNLQQYYVEQCLVDVLDCTPQTELRWKTRATSLHTRGDIVEIGVETPAGPYTLTADYVIAADGSRSTIRTLLGLEFAGEVFQDHFLIADIRMRGDWPAERWFWFDPPFARGQSALLHKQPDDLWRLDFQLGWNIDRERELEPARVRDRVAALIGADTPFDLEWSSIYTFQCRRLEKFVHDRVIFAGDAAHLVSPFGARGANGGVQDVDNLCWKLALVLQGRASRRLLGTYEVERGQAADENIRHSTRSSGFITPKNAASRALRDAALELARHRPEIRPFVNSGRLSTACVPRESPLHGAGTSVLRCGAPAPDLPVMRSGQRRWLLDELDGFTALACVDPRDRPPEVDDAARCRVIPVSASGDGLQDPDGALATALGATPGDCLLFRPDQTLLGVRHRPGPGVLEADIARCLAGGAGAHE